MMLLINWYIINIVCVARAAPRAAVGTPSIRSHWVAPAAALCLVDRHTCSLMMCLNYTQHSHIDLYDILKAFQIYVA